MYGAVYDKAVMLSAGSTNKEYAKTCLRHCVNLMNLALKWYLPNFPKKTATDFWQ